MEKLMKNAVKQKMVNYLSKTNGHNTFTVAQGRRLFGVKNVAARIQELRAEGYSIYTNTKTLSDGRKVTYYKLGKPSRQVIAAGYEILRSMGIKTFG
jgi:hypothetical protein